MEDEAKGLVIGHKVRKTVEERIIRSARPPSLSLLLLDCLLLSSWCGELCGGFAEDASLLACCVHTCFPHPHPWALLLLFTASMGPGGGSP